MTDDDLSQSELDADAEGFTEVTLDKPTSIFDELQTEADEARAELTLVDLFSADAPDSKVLASKKSLVFRDLKAVDEYNQLNDAKLGLQQMIEALGEPKPKEDAAVKTKRKEYEAAHAEARARADVARAAMLKSALSFHLRAYPGIALKVAKREARKIFVDPKTGQLREGVDSAEVQEWMDLYLFGETVQAVYSSDGKEVGFGVPKAELGEVLSNKMHPVIWQQLFEDFQEITLRTGARRAVLEDPGF